MEETGLARKRREGKKLLSAGLELRTVIHDDDDDDDNNNNDNNNNNNNDNKVNKIFQQPKESYKDVMWINI